MTEPDASPVATHRLTPVLPLPRAGPLTRCGWALLEWIAHTVLIIGVIACVAAIDLAIRLLMRSDHPTFFSVFPVHWIFDAADCGALLGFSILGVRASLAAYRGER
jgi:hypothetical protein